MRYFHANPNTEISLVVTNKPQAGVIQIAKKYDVQVLIVNNEQLNNEEFLLNELKSYQINGIVLAGFMVMIPPFLVRAFHNKIINIHPALLPDFGGKGMYGKRVHEAVLSSGKKKSGITIHLVNEEYDEGKIIFQKEIPLAENETTFSLEEKIHQLEHENYPLVIEKWMNHEL